MKLYFGFGANRDATVIKAITGRSALHLPASLDGWHLCVQQLNDIPKKVQRLLRRAWGDSFVSYGIVKEPSSRVTGTLWLLTNAQRQAIHDWEFIGSWSHNVQVKVKISLFGLKFLVDAETEHLAKQKVTLVDGLTYPTYLVPKAHILQIAEGIRIAPKL
ncbi:TPA: hypothetical protein DEP96_02045 [Candidatus Uhrbacteria bacterium]|nr:hypothetical protein [Candidatus Uhrbacteria bacterium]